MKKNYILGLDIGISSVGWGLLELDENDNPCKIIDVGSRIFTPGETEKTGDSRAKERREHRGARRLIRRREFRLDRVKNLLYEENFLNGEVTSDIVSIKNEELTVLFDKMIKNYYKNKNTNPYKLKVDALDRKLTNEELGIILVHYAKRRGYKSNREDDNAGGKDKESGKVKSSIAENIKIMKDKGYRTISEMYIKDEKFKNKIKNSPNDYKLSVTNEMYLEEINKVLNAQIEYGLIDEKFKNKYLDIYNSRRHYSEGPGYYYEYDEDGNKIQKRSPYGGNDLIERMVGKCSFDHNPRAPRMAFSSELYVALTKLVNLRYKIDNGEYKALNSEQINDILDVAKCKNVVKYKDLTKLLGDYIIYKGLSLNTIDYKKVIKKLKTELKIPESEDLNIKDLNDEQKHIYNELYKKQIEDLELIKLEGYHKLRCIVEKTFDKDKWNNIKDNMKLLDDLALLCTNYKLNEEILNKIKESEFIDNDFADIEFVKELPNFKGHLKLSTQLIYKLIPLMIEGNTYDKAMDIIGYNHSSEDSDIEKQDLLFPILVNDNIRNQRVIRSLTQARKVINSIIKKYGTPKIINIETARDLAKTYEERKKIEKDNKEKYSNNERDKKLLVELGPFDSVDKISSNDLLKYRLWKEQNEFCGYSMRKISYEDLYSDNLVQIDHILPYSRTFNDNYLNKTLVYTKENQNKRNLTPFEWFGEDSQKWSSYESFINSLNISQKKKDNYLLKKLDFDTEREMRNQNLNDTKYISKELSSLLKAYLNVDKINMYSGSITAKLRARWGFNRLTHSYISENYYMPESMKIDINKDRDNHLHHAMDALVIASITKSLENKITLYEKFSRYIDGVMKNNLNDLKYGKISDDVVQFYDERTGEIDAVRFRAYLEEKIAKEDIYFDKHGVSRLKFPLPYENFDKEAKYRVYERDLNQLRFNIDGLKTYTNEEINNLHVLVPSIAKAKASGAMHEDTYYGMYETEDQDGNRKLFKTLKTPIEKVKKKDLENIPDKNGGSKDIYNCLIEWFDEGIKLCENDISDYDKLTGKDILTLNGNKYPINKNDKEHKEIKRLKVYTEYNDKGHFINNSNVEKGGIYRIEVFKSKDIEDDKLYFAGLDVLEIEKIKSIKQRNKYDDKFLVRLEYAQGKNYKVLPYQEIMRSYVIYNVFLKNDLVKIINKDNKECIGYINGFTSGMLELKSPLGDGYDLINNRLNKNAIFGKQRSQYSITVSKIKEIQKLSINILGDINGL